jgi:uncharacterized OB-fold protein
VDYPIPVLDGDSKPYWEGVEQGELRIQLCSDCNKHIFYPRSICPHCFSDHVEWVTASGRGRIHSYTVVHQSYGPFAAQTPFVVAIIELEEGVRLMSRVVGSREHIAIDKPVEVFFEKPDDNLTLPYFKITEYSSREST